ncbi:aromatic amino acid DMT transporter YddG [Acidipropionibacterium acidipropionici]|nr:aromatic amino acid DMT transporter YddG [Acidipropionibacterium acidipropionici]
MASTPQAVQSRRATAIGVAAILLWSGIVGLIRVTTQHFGATLGPSLIYTLAAALLWLTRRPKSLRGFSARYLLLGGGMFVIYEVALAMAVGLSDDAHQTIEVSIVNYLWPTLTVALAAVVNRRERRPGLLIIPGVLLATVGVVGAVGGEAGLSPTRIAANVMSNPLPYLLSLMAAAVWAAYSVFSPRLAGGRDGITVFISGVAAALWIVNLVSPAPVGDITASGVAGLIGAAAVIASGYASWNVGILHGNITLLASASYATPVLSTAVSSLLLGAVLPLTFWGNVLLVVAGSLAGWWATRRTGRR